MRRSDVRHVDQTTGSVTDGAHCMTRPPDKRGRALRARSEASMIARMRVARLSAAPAPTSDAELIAEAIAAGKVRHIPRGISGLPEFAPSEGSVGLELSAEPIEARDVTAVT